MELKKEDIQTLRVKSRATSQVTFDADYNVPDVKPDIGRMIQNKGEVEVEEVRLNDGHAFVRGSLNVDLLYVGEEEGRVYGRKKGLEFRVTYQSGKELYLIRGYGKQMSGGYSIQVKELSASSTAVFFETKLMGPSAEEQSGAPSYPYIAVKIQYRKEPVQFQ